VGGGQLLTQLKLANSAKLPKPAKTSKTQKKAPAARQKFTLEHKYSRDLHILKRQPKMTKNYSPEFSGLNRDLNPGPVTIFLLRGGFEARSD
jgi:hypothetical protein